MKNMATLINALLLAPLAVLSATEVSPVHEPPKPDWKVLDCAVSWVGNSFGGKDGKFVQHDTECLFVTPDGTCLMNVPWEEGGNNVGVYKDGQHLGSAGHTHGWGYGGGYAVTANDDFVFVAETVDNEGGNLHKLNQEAFPPPGKGWCGVTRRTRSSLGQKPAPFEGGRGTHGASLTRSFLIVNEVDRPNKSNAAQRPDIRGLALDSKGRLFVSNPWTSQILVFDSRTMKQLAAWPCANSRQIACGPDDSLWVIAATTNDKPARIIRFGSDGALRPQIVADVAVPTALAFDPQGRLLVADNGPDQQIRIYDQLDAQPRLAGTFGVRGGVFAEPRGQIGPQRFNGLAGVGADAAGNLYVACKGWGLGSQCVTIESYTPAGKTNWRLEGLLFVDIGDVDPSSDGKTYYTREEVFTLDYEKAVPGSEWRFARFHRDAQRYAGESGGNTVSLGNSVFARRIQGRPLLFLTDMGAGFLQVKRFDADGMSVPSCLFEPRAKKANEWPPHRPTGTFLWRDLNGDGRFDADEYEAGEKQDPATWAWCVDSRGHVWQGYQDASAIVEFPCGGLDTHGNPIYSHKTAKRHDVPAAFKRIERVLYQPETDLMLLSGYDDLKTRRRDWKTIGPILACYDVWKGTPRQRWLIDFEKLGIQNESRDTRVHKYPVSLAVAGEYVFVVQMTPPFVHVFRLSDGTHVGVMKPSPEIGGPSGSGWVDLPYGLRAIQRSNGEYVVFVEEDYRSKNVMYRWFVPRTTSPKEAAASPAPLLPHSNPGQ
jgi:sugar lactone lactonase YvrE